MGEEACKEGSSSEAASSSPPPPSGDTAERMRIEMERVIRRVEEKDAQDSNDGYNYEFLMIRLENDDMRELDEFAATAGESEENLCRNRYRDILPYDYSRVKLEPLAPFAETHDYINASFVNGASGRVSYIAAQGPVPDSLADFWRCVLQHSVQLIVMVCNLEEVGKRKCERYWPEEVGGPPLTLAASGVTVEQVKPTEDLGQDLLQRFFRVTVPAQGETPRYERIVRQLHYTKWPDHGAPATAEPILHLLQEMRSIQPYDRTPILVHCSAGVGRTGTIIALDYVRALLHSGRLASMELEIKDIVLELRRQRPAMVQTSEQYVILHRCVAELFRRRLALLDDHHYHNLPLAPQPPAKDSSSPPNGAMENGEEETAAAAAPEPPESPVSSVVVGGVRILDYPNWPEEKPKGPEEAPSAEAEASAAD